MCDRRKEKLRNVEINLLIKKRPLKKRPCHPCIPNTQIKKKKKQVPQLSESGI